MTVSANVSRVTFAGDDATTSFDLGSTFIFFDDTDLVVEVVTDATGASEELTLNVDYTVSGGDGATGTVDTSGGSSPHGALVSDTTLVIRRVLPIIQTDDYVNGAISDAEVIEDRVDRLTMIAQQLDDESARALRAPPSESEVDNLPTRAARRGKFFKFDGTVDAKPTAVAVTELGTGLVLDEDDFASDSEDNAPSQQSVTTYLKNTFLIDEDSFATNSATRPPSQQSTKAYISTAIDDALLDHITETATAELTNESETIYDVVNGAATFTLPEASTAAANDIVVLRLFTSSVGTEAKVQVQNHANDSGTLRWIGTSAGDYIRFIKRGSAWFVLDHYESIYLNIFVNADESIVSGASEQLTSLTAGKDPASLFSIDEVAFPALASLVTFSHNVLSITDGNSAISAEAKIGSTYIRDASAAGTASGPSRDASTLSVHDLEVAASTTLQFWAKNHHSSGAQLVLGDAAGDESLAYVSIRWRI